MSNEFPTPRQAAESIVHNAEQLARFIHDCRVSLFASGDLLKWGNELKKERGADADLGTLAKTFERVDKIFVTLVFNDIDQASYLFGLGTVRLWTTLEAGVNDLVLALMKRDDRWKCLPAFQKIKVSAAEFVALSEKEQMKQLLDVYMTNAGSRQKLGVGRFEDILNAAGMGGEVDRHVAKVILELGETRHVLVHRGGVPDAKFEARCPWVPKFGGGIIRVTPAVFSTYLLAVMVYMAELMARLQQKEWLDGSTDEKWASVRDGGIARLRTNVETAVRTDPDSPQARWEESLIWKDGVAPPNPFMTTSSSGDPRNSS